MSWDTEQEYDFGVNSSLARYLEELAAQQRPPRETEENRDTNLYRPQPYSTTWPTLVER